MATAMINCVMSGNVIIGSDAVSLATSYNLELLSLSCKLIFAGLIHMTRWVLAEIKQTTFLLHLNFRM